MQMMFKTKIIELFGLPRTGKTTTAIAVKKHLRSLGYKVDIIKERASACPLSDKLHPSFNYWTSISLFKEYLEANDKGFDFVIADRGIFDAYVWVNFLVQTINDKALKVEFLSLVNQDFILSNYFLTFYFSAKTDIILDREFQRQVERKYGKVMNPETLSKYRESYKNSHSNLLKWCEIKEIDSSELTINDTIKLVSKEIQDKITTANNMYIA